MENKVIHQTLAELEDSLIQLESARNQVNQVSKKSEDLVGAFSKILKQLDKIESENVFDQTEIKKKIESSLQKFKMDMQSISDKFLGENSKITSSWKSELDTLNSTIDKTENSLQKFGKELQSSEKRIAAFDIKSDFDKLFSEHRNEIKKIATSQVDGVSSLKTQISSGFKEALHQINEIDTRKVLAELNKKIETNSLNTKKMEEDFQSQLLQIKQEVNKSGENINSKVDQLSNRMLFLNIGLALFVVLLFFLLK